MINRLTFPVDTDSPYAVKRMAEHLQAGGKLVLFPEGRLSRSGALMKLFEGTGFLLFKTHAKVITCYLRGARRLPFSPNPNRKKWLARVTAHFSGVLTPPHPAGAGAARARQKLTRWLYDTMVKQQFDIEQAVAPKNILAAILATARQFPGVVALEDVSHRKLTYRRLLAGADALAGQWRRQWPGQAPGARRRAAARFPGHAADAAQFVGSGKNSGDSQFFHRHPPPCSPAPNWRESNRSLRQNYFWSGPD